MEMRNIDDIAQLDLASVTKAQLAVISRTGKTVEGEGGEEAPPSARLGVVCELGNLEQSVWLSACQQIAEKEPDGPATIARLQNFFRSALPGEHGQEFLQVLAMEAYVGDAPADPEWPYYEQYHAF